MGDLVSLVDDFLNSLDKSEEIIFLKNSYLECYNDEELMNMINEYNKNVDPKLKELIENDDKIREVRKAEAELSYIILEINNRLKSISVGRSCT